MVKTQKFISEEEVAEIIGKRDHIREQRRLKRKALKEAEKNGAKNE